MANKYVVSVFNETPDEINSFHKYLESIGAGYWHRAGTIWLVTISTLYNAEAFLNIVQIYFPRKRMIVVNLQDNVWAGWGTPEEFKWFQDNWN